MFITKLTRILKTLFKMMKKQRIILKEVEALAAEGKIPEEMLKHYEIVKKDGKGQPAVTDNSGKKTNLEQTQFIYDFAADVLENVDLFPESMHDDIAVYLAHVEKLHEIVLEMDEQDAAKKAAKEAAGESEEENSAPATEEAAEETSKED